MRGNWPFDVPMAVVGMIHLRPLPGSPGYSGDLGDVVRAAVRDASALESGGVDGLMVENFGDVPFFKDSVPPETVSSMARAVGEVLNETSLPVGVNVLRNDSMAALSIAYSFGAKFIRANIFTEAYVTDQGIIEGNAARLMRLRHSLGAESIGVWADVRSKHAHPMSGLSLRSSALDAVERGLADAVVITGERTGLPPGHSDLRKVREITGRLVIGSGIDSSNAESLMPLADAAIVGSSLKKGGLVMSPVDTHRVSELMKVVRKLRQS